MVQGCWIMLVFMFSLVTMEKIRIDGFHGDHLKISFFEGLDMAAGFTECSGCHQGFRVAVPEAGLNEHSNPSCSCPWRRWATRVGDLHDPAPSSVQLTGSFIFLRTPLHSGNFQASMERSDSNMTNSVYLFPSCSILPVLFYSSPPHFFGRIGAFLFNSRI